MPDAYPLPSADPASLGFAATPFQNLDRLIRRSRARANHPQNSARRAMQPQPAGDV